MAFARSPAAAALLALAILALGGPAAARNLTSGENAALARTVEKFDAAMRASDMETVVGVIPPGVLAEIARQSGVDVDKLRQLAIEQSSRTMAATAVLSFGMEMADAEYKELSDGTPYVLIPTEMVMDAGSGKMQANTKTLALLDNDTWYLLRIDDAQQVQILQKAYPEFAGVAFEPGSMKAVE